MAETLDKRNFIFADSTVTPVGTMYCIGKNYALHAAEMGDDKPRSEPLVFLKPPAAYLPHGSIVALPFDQGAIHHEVEMVVVIGRDAENVSADSAARFIAGYAVGIDLTLRDVQREAKNNGWPWARAKAFAGSAPISQIVPAYALDGGRGDFDLELYVNGYLRQSGNTRDMTYSVNELIAWLSGIFTLRRGDCIFTGTPHGVGSIDPGDKLEARLGSVARLEIEVEAAAS